MVAFGREDTLVAEQILYPGHYIVDVCGSGEVDAFAVLVYPSVAQPNQRTEIREG